MKDIFRKKTRLEKLKARYTELMRKSFKASLKDQEKSEKVRKQAQEIYEEIQYLSVKYADK